MGPWTSNSWFAEWFAEWFAVNAATASHVFLVLVIVQSITWYVILLIFYDGKGLSWQAHKFHIGRASRKIMRWLDTLFLCYLYVLELGVSVSSYIFWVNLFSCWICFWNFRVWLGFVAFPREQVVSPTTRRVSPLPSDFWAFSSWCKPNTMARFLQESNRTRNQQTPAKYMWDIVEHVEPLIKSRP